MRWRPQATPWEFPMTIERTMLVIGDIGSEHWDCRTKVRFVRIAANLSKWWMVRWAILLRYF
jgi:hypothetical protein